jgi:Leucine-rich repeat (LRR) protein
VNITDNNLRAAINAALGRPALDAITTGQMKQLTALNISGRGITNLTGLEHATNLTYLDVSNNVIVSFEPIKNLVLPMIVRTGDINADGMVDIVDFHLLQQKLLGNATINSQQYVRADMFPISNGDSKLDISDLWILKKQLLNTPLP